MTDADRLSLALMMFSIMLLCLKILLEVSDIKERIKKLEDKLP